MPVLQRARRLPLSCLATTAGPSTSAAGPAGVPAAPTFTRDVAPILYSRCVGCHRPGEVAPTLFDHSPKNVYNPAAENEVFRSDQSWDEMYAPQARIAVDSRQLKTTGRPSEPRQQH